MSTSKTFIGKVFISHSAIDKPLVRKLSRAIKSGGFEVWLDEHELVVGDPLGKRIAEALQVAKVVIVVVSPDSMKSHWLKYELNLATERMVKGECRVIPVVIGGDDIPPEVMGLLYADFRVSFASGLKAIKTALAYEAEKAAQDERFGVRLESLMEEVFGGKGSVSLMGDYEDTTYDVVHLPVPNYNDEHTSVVYEIVSATKPEKPLTDVWWNEYKGAAEQLKEDLFLVVTQRPLEFKARRTRGPSKRVAYRALSTKYSTPNGPQVVIADLSSMDLELQRLVLEEAKDLLLDLAQRLKARGKKRFDKDALIIYHNYPEHQN